MADLCGVCNAATPKYKCPAPGCGLRYCSLACYKLHKPTHPPPDPSTTSSSSSTDVTTNTAPPALPTPPTATPTPTDPLARLHHHPEFLRLFARYPSLPSHLGQLYRRTLPPSAPDSLYRSPNIHGRGGRGRGRGRGAHHRGGRGGSMSGGGGEWTPDNGDACALAELRALMAREGAEAEGLREFVELVRLVQGG